MQFQQFKFATKKSLDLPDLPFHLFYSEKQSCIFQRVKQFWFELGFGCNIIILNICKLNS